MGRKKLSGSSISMNQEINIKGPEVRTRGKKGKSWPVLTEPTPDYSGQIAAMLPALMGTVPISAGVGGAGSPLMMAAMGSVCAAAGIALAPNPAGAGYLTAYVNILQRVMTGATAADAKLDEEKLKKLILALLARMLEKAGPAYSSFSQILADAMERATLKDYMKGVQAALCALINDPVNANTGNFIYEKEDLALKGQIPLVFKRSYNRIDSRSGSMGSGWRHNYEIRLLIESDRCVILWADGREEPFLRDQDNTLLPLFGGYSRLTRDGSHYQYKTQDNLTYRFDQNGALKSQTSQTGQGIQFSYDQNGRLSRAATSHGTFLTYRYDGDTERLRTVTDHTGRSVTLTYELNRLKEVKNPAGESYAYTYDADKGIHRIRNPRGITVLENEYDDQGRAVKQTFADGGTVTYQYQKEQSRTLVTDQNGVKTVYVHDSRYRNIKTIYQDGEETFQYNERNQLTVKTDKKGNKTKLAYDDRGNTAQIIYPDGAKYNMTYDGDNRLLTLSVNGINKVKNTYDKNGNLLKTTDALGRSHAIAYDETGKAVSLTRPDKSTLTMDYDSHGNLIRLTDPAGAATEYQYNDRNQVIRTVDGNGNTAGYRYDEADRITRIINAAGNSRIFQYTQNGKLTKLTDYNGAVTSQTYNNMNQVETIIMPDGGVTRMEYDQMQNVISRTLPNGARITYTYDPQNRLEQTCLPNGGIIRYEYDPNGNRTAVIDPEGNRTVQSYDERDRLIKTTGPDGAVTEYEYDLEGRLTSIADAAGTQRAYTYDAAGQLISETTRQGTTCCEYNELGDVAAIIRPGGQATTYTYAPGGRLHSIRLPDGAGETYTYDKNGNLTSRRNQNGETLTYTYNCMNQVTAVASSHGQKKSCTYDTVGRLTSVTDTLGHTTRYEYTSGGTLGSVLDAAGNRTEYAYDPMGDLITICQHEGSGILMPRTRPVVSRPALNPSMGTGQDVNQLPTIQAPAGVQYHLTSYQRNLMGQIETITNPLGQQEHYNYDLMGNLIQKTDRDGFETRYAYTSFGALEQIAYADGRTADFAYNPLRQLIEIKDWLGTTKIELDSQGRTKKITDYNGRTLTYQWDQNGNRTALIYPDGTKTTYEYDQLARLSQLTDGTDTIQYQYDEQSRLIQKNCPDGLVSRYEYNPMGLLSSLTHQKDGKTLEQRQYQYDLMGNKTAIQTKRNTDIQDPGIPPELSRKLREENGCYQYRYDTLNRLTQVQKDRVTLRRYDYDAFGNRIRQTSEQGTTRYYYNQANQLIQTEGAGPEQNCQYDNRGNLTAILQGTKLLNQYQYDETNRLAAAFNCTGQAASYQYDGLGNRVGRLEYALPIPAAGHSSAPNLNSNPALRSSLLEQLQAERPAKEAEYLLDRTKQYHNLLEQSETIGENKITQRYTWDSNVAFLNEGETKQTYLQDELGSPVRLVGMEKRQQIVYGYDEFGQDLYDNQGEVQPFGYTGYQIDGISNTCFAQAREYLPAIGRFGGEDRVGGKIIWPFSLNRYNYCWENPMIFVDPDGRAPRNVQKKRNKGRKSVGEQWGDVVTSIGDTASSAWNSVADSASSAWDSFVDTASSAWDSFVDTASNAWDSVESVAGNTWNDVVETSQDAWDTFKSGWNGFMDFNINLNKTGMEIFETLTGAKTMNISLSGRAEMGASVSGTLGVTHDSAGNIAVQYSINGGGGLPGLGGGLDVMGTNAPLYSDVEGMAGVVGGSFAPGLSFGYDQLIMSNGYLGSSFCIGPGVNNPYTGCVEMHGELGYTGTLFHFNIYDIYEGLKFKDKNSCNN